MEAGAKLIGWSVGIAVSAGLLGTMLLWVTLDVVVGGQGAAFGVGFFGVAALLALVAGGWAALILHGRDQRLWLPFAVVAVLLQGGLFAGALAVGVAVAFAWASQVVLLGCELVAASVVQAGDRPPREPWWHVAAAVAWPVALLVGVFLATVAENAVAARAG